MSTPNPPRAGYANSVDGYELPGSGVDGAFLDSNTATGLICHNLSSSVPGRYFSPSETANLCLEPAPRMNQSAGVRHSAAASAMSRV
jgi:hypothetical protein